MAMVEPKTKILEDGTEELIEQQQDEEGVEYADLSAEPTSTVEAKPATDKPAAKTGETKPATDTAPAEDDVPAALKGKTPGQLAKMYADAQALIGRQGQELGSYRNKFDQFIQADLAARTAAAKAAAAAKPAATAPTPEEEEAAFFAKPKDAIAKAIENHPLIKQIQETLGAGAKTAAVTRMQENKTKFDSAHPDAAEIMETPEFREWVKASPIRVSLMEAAHKRYDFAAGNEVFSTWKAIQGAKAKADPKADEAAAASAAAATLAKRKATLKAAGVPTAGAGNGGGQGSAPTGGKIYRRADILELMESNPERYEAMIDEIQLAYQERRVR